MVQKLGVCHLPAGGAGEVVLQHQRFDGLAVVPLVHEQADLPVDVPGVPALRCGVQEDDFVVAPLQVVPEAAGALVVVAKVVASVNQYRSPAKVFLSQQDAMLVGFCLLCF